MSELRIVNLMPSHLPIHGLFPNQMQMDETPVDLDII